MSTQTTAAADELREQVRRRYAEAARTVLEGSSAGCGGGACCESDPRGAFGDVLYSAEERTEIPAAAALASLGCGSPTAARMRSEPSVCRSTSEQRRTCRSRAISCTTVDRNDRPSVLGRMIGGALVGTFLGVFLSYCLTGPLAARIRTIQEDDHRFYALIRDVLVAYLHRHAPGVCVEIGRKNVPGAVRPGFIEVEQALNALKVQVARQAA